MTRYTVVWHEDALNQLAELWMDANDREDIRLATNQIDQDLCIDADRKGAEIVDELKELVAEPLRVLFSVSDADRLVRIVNVART